MLVPDEIQEKHIQTIMNSAGGGGALIAESMGVGKTLIATEVIVRSGAKVVVIVCPLATRVSWERTLTSQGFKYPIHRISAGQKPEETYELVKKGEPGAYLIGTGFFKSPKWDWTKVKKVDIAVVDESHKFANRQSVGFRRLMKLKPSFRIAMSGTPWGNKIENMWAGSRWAFPKWAGTSFWTWASQWLTMRNVEIYRKDPKTGVPKAQEFPEFTGEKEPGAYVKYLPVFLRTPGTHKDIPPVRYDKLFVELTPLQRRMYDKFEQDAIIFVQDNPLVAQIPLTKRIRLRQMTLGSVTVDEAGVVDFPDNMKSAKFDALKEFLEDNPDNVLILTDSKKYANIVAERLGDDARVWSGDTPHATREEYIAEFGVSFKYLVAVIAALDAGVDGLQKNCNTMVWMSRSEDGVTNQQTEARLARRGQPADYVLSIDIMAVDTYDEAIDSSLYFKNKLIKSTLGE